MRAKGVRNAMCKEKFVDGAKTWMKMATLNLTQIHLQRWGSNNFNWNQNESPL